MRKLFLFMLLAIGQDLFAQDLPTILTQDSTVKQQLVFTGQLNFRFFRIFSKNRLFKEVLSLNKPFHAYSKHLSKGSNGKWQSNYFSIILFPGDSVSIQRDQKMISKRGYSQMIDSLLSLSEGDYIHVSTIGNKLLKDSIRPMIEYIKAEFHEREKKIAKLGLSEEQTNTLYDFNYLIQASRISKIPFSSLKLNTNDISLLDSCAQNFRLNMDRLNRIESSFQISIYHFLIKYSAFRNGVNEGAFWDFAFKADKQLQNEPYYLPYLLLNFENGYDKPKLPFELLQKIESSKSTGVNIATFKRILTILDKSLINFRQSQEELAQLSSGKYAHLLSSARYDQRNINKIKPVSMVDYNGKMVDFKQQILSSRAKITVIDFWAQWCVPCIQDYPYLKIVKKFFKSNPIDFLSVSIDKDGDDLKWKAMIDKLDGKDTINQYRILEMSIKTISDYFNIQSVPRYIIIGKNGEVLSYEFFRPSDNKFKMELGKLLNEQ